MNNTLQLAACIFLLPVSAFTILALTNRRLPRNGDWLGTGAMGTALILALAIFWRALHSESNLLGDFSFNWFPVGGGRFITGGWMVDSLTAVMMVVVCTVSFLVHLFSTKYLEGDVRYGRYYCGLSIFSTSMLGLVLCNNLLFLFIFWELVGLSSYLLIGHWFEKKSASNAAIKAFITTRVGDVGMLIGLLICYMKVGSLHYADLFSAVQTGTLGGQWLTVAGLGLFLGAMGKSAQFPLHVWLPDAMEGPTPVSALIHAATMVAAGVYLVGRLHPLFDPKALLFIAYIGGITALFAATIALVQDDIKKVLAYSTVSQLGYMVMALGVGGYSSGLFHLTTHAFFKAGLFLGSGAVIYAMHHEQSLSKYGGLWRKMPKTALFYLLATLALCGFPGFSGFWSKDAILGDTLAFSMIHEGHWFLPFAGFFTAFLTAFYMFRQYLLTFTGKPRDAHAYDHAHEVPWPMLTALVVLGTLAVVSGGLGGWFKTMNPARTGSEQIQAFVTAGHTSPAVVEFLNHEEGAVVTPASAEHAAQAHGEQAAHEESVEEAAAHAVATAEHGEPGAEHGAAAEGEHGASHEEHVRHMAHVLAMKLSIPLALLGIALGFAFFWERKSGRALLNPDVVARAFRPIHTLLWNKYYFDELYDLLFIRTTVLKGKLMALFDRTVIDGIVNLVASVGRVGAFVVDLADRMIVDDWMVMGTARGAAFTGENLARAQTGRVRQYLLMSIVGLAVLATVCVWLLK